MSEYQTPQDFSFSARDVLFNMTIIEVFADGIYSAIFWFTIYTMLTRKKEKWTLTSRITFVIVILLYVLCMIHMSLRWATMRRAFVVDGDTADDILNSYLTKPNWINAVSVITYSLASLIADYVSIWRCWVIWSRNWKVAIVPLLMMLTGTAFMIMGAVFQIDPNSGLSTRDFNKFAKFTLVYFAMSLCSTATTTGLITYRILSVVRGGGFSLQNTSRKALEIVVESAALYSIALLVYLPFISQDDFSDGYPQAVLIAIIGIAPTLITARVALGYARDYSTTSNHSPPISSRSDHICTSTYSGPKV